MSTASSCLAAWIHRWTSCLTSGSSQIWCRYCLELADVLLLRALMLSVCSKQSCSAPWVWVQRERAVWFGSWSMSIVHPLLLLLWSVGTSVGSKGFLLVCVSFPCGGSMYVLVFVLYYSCVCYQQIVLIGSSQLSRLLMLTGFGCFCWFLPVLLKSDRFLYCKSVRFFG
jgi:hypothetical protein